MSQVVQNTNLRVSIFELLEVADMLASLKKKKTLVLKYQAFNANKAVINFDFSGFDSVFEKIKQ